MNYRFIAILLILFFLSLAAVNAAGDDNQTMQINNDVEEDELSASEGSFIELQQLILKDGDYITLDKDYAYNMGFPTDGVEISKNVIIDGQGHRLDGKGASRIFHISNITTHVVIKNINFVNALDSAICCDGQYVGITECQFSNNYRAITLKNNGGNVFHCTFNNNHVIEGSGGAILVEGNLNTIMQNSFTGNSAKNGGAICVLGNSTLISNNTFSDNRAYSDGGAIDIINSKYSTAIIANTFTGNTAANGGAINEKDSYFSIYLNKFFKNHGSELGGAIRIDGLSEMGIIQYNTFDGDYCDYEAGAIFSDAEKLRIYKNNFTNTKSDGDGGAIFFKGNEGEISHNNFIGAYSKSNGGAAYVNANNSILTDNLFIENTAELNGGAIFLYGDYEYRIINSTFINSSINAICPYENVKLVNSTVIPQDKDYVILAADLTKYYGKNERFTVNVYNKNGTPLKNLTLIININEKDYERTTDENGTASMAINLGVGNYTATVSLKNDTSVNITSAITVKTTIEGNDLTKIERSPVPYYAYFRDSNGNLLSEGKAQFNINGVMYYRDITNGRSQLNINLGAGTYIITATNPVTGQMASNTVTINKRIVNNSDVTKFFKNGTQYYVTVLDDEGNPCENGTNVTFNINGVFYTRQTNENGTVRLNINLSPGEFIITAIYKGCMASNNIKVLPILSAKDMTMSYRDGSKFAATLLNDQGNPYANQNVTFNINGVFYDRETDENGTARLNINLSPGEFIITSMYNGFAIANTITIKSQ